jgi:CheY-like chemotaxis protein
MRSYLIALENSVEDTSLASHSSGIPNRQSIPRVLFVDNKVSTRELFQKLLEHWGCQPVIAEGEGDDLLQDAENKAKTQRCQLALVDMRLQDNTDPTDNSGLDLIPRLAPTQTIIISAYGDKKDFRLALSRGALSFVGKEEDVINMRKELDSALGKLCACRRELLFEPAQVLDQITNTLATTNTAYVEDQVKDTLARLFPHARRLTLEYLDQDSSSVTLSSVPRPRSSILRVIEDDRQPVIVKLARAHKIHKEVKAYNDYIHGHIYAYLSPELRDEVVLWDVGGARYSYLGSPADVKTFSNYYKSAHTSEIDYSLGQFFAQSWQVLYAKKNQKELSLFQAYCDVWELDWYNRISTFDAPDPTIVMGKERRQKMGIPEPVSWFKNRVKAEMDNSLNVKAEITLAVTHGDLHGDNLLIDSGGKPWIIDFERSGPGPILQDFVELESDILNRLSPCGDDFRSFYHICVCIARQEILQEIGGLEKISDESISKVLNTVSTLRKLAREMTGELDARSYLWGLLYNTLFRATIIDGMRDRPQQMRGLMLASILCHRLEHWGESWPPPSWSAV